MRSSVRSRQAPPFIFGELRLIADARCFVHKTSFACPIRHASRVDEGICGFQDIVKRKHIRMIPGLMSGIRADLKDLDKIMHTSRGQA